MAEYKEVTHNTVKASEDTYYNNYEYGQVKEQLTPGIEVRETNSGTTFKNVQISITAGQATGTYYYTGLEFRPKHINFEGTGGDGFCQMNTDGLYNNGSRVYWSSGQIRSGTNNRMLNLYKESTSGYLLVDFASFTDDGFAYNVIQSDFGGTVMVTFIG